MTAYLLTEQQHAQIVEALKFAPQAAGPEDSYQDEHFEAKADSYKRCEAALAPALAMLKAMKPVEPVGFTDSRGRFFYKNDPWMIQDHSGMPALYTLGDEE